MSHDDNVFQLNPDMPLPELPGHRLRDHPRIIALRSQIAALEVNESYRRKLLRSLDLYADQVVAGPDCGSGEGWDDLEALQHVTTSDEWERMQQRAITAMNRATPVPVPSHKEAASAECDESAANLPTSDYVEDDIRECVAEDPGWGNFERILRLGNGFVVFYMFSWAVGTGSLHYRRQYRLKFGQSAPAWIERLHPLHLFQLCKRAANANRRLPEVLNFDLDEFISTRPWAIRDSEFLKRLEKTDGEEDK